MCRALPGGGVDPEDLAVVHVQALREGLGAVEPGEAEVSQRQQEIPLRAPGEPPAGLRIVKGPVAATQGLDSNRVRQPEAASGAPSSPQPRSRAETRWV